MFIDHTVAYDTVWHLDLVCKLLQLLPDRHMVEMMMKLVDIRSFTLTTGCGKKSRLRRLNNGVPWGSVLAPLLFNVYTHDLPPITLRIYAYANDLAIEHPVVVWISLKRTQNQDIATISPYLQKWKLKLSKTKIVLTAFQLKNKEAKRELNIWLKKTTCRKTPCLPTSGLPWIESSCINNTWRPCARSLQSRIATIRRLGGTSWVVRTTTLRSLLWLLFIPPMNTAQDPNTYVRQTNQWCLAYCHRMHETNSNRVTNNSLWHPTC